MADGTGRIDDLSSDGFSRHGNLTMRAAIGASATAEGERSDDSTFRLVTLLEKQLGVRSAPDLLALLGAEGGREAIASAIDAPKRSIETLARIARSALPEGAAEQLERPPVRQFATGAVLPSEEEIAAATAIPATVTRASVPAAFHFVHDMFAVRNQGGRGTCVAYTVTAVNEYRLSKNFDRFVDLSEQHLYFEAKQLDGMPSAFGTTIGAAARALGTRGQCRESIWPYRDDVFQNTNVHGSMPANARSNGVRFLCNLQQLNPRDVAGIRAALASRKPVAIAVPFYPLSWRTRNIDVTGEIKMPMGSQNGGHAVCLVGYQDDSSSPGGGFFILRNSWGTTSWGKACSYGMGYGTIPYGYIQQYGGEAYTTAADISAADLDDELAADSGERGIEPPRKNDTKMADERTVTITIRGNVNLIVE